MTPFAPDCRSAAADQRRHVHKWHAAALSIALLVQTATVATAGAADATDTDSALRAAGRAIYEQGLLPDGRAVVAQRAGGIELRGPAAACSQCHRRSGFGGSEGLTTVPPVIGSALFEAPLRPGGHRPRQAPNMGFRDFAHLQRPPYDAATFARALNAGLASDGRALHFLMPRYALDDAALAALTAHLRSLTTGPSPGVEAGAIHLATVVTPDADPQQSAAALAVLRACSAEQQPARGYRWQLHEWRLQGAPAQWAEQLAARAAQQPVFAMLSGVGGEHWQPVHDFCEAQRLPCLFPNVALPGGGDGSVYSFYLSAGAELEAQAMAARLQAQPPSSRRVLQVAEAGSAGEQAARALARALDGSTLRAELRTLSPAAAGDVIDPLTGIGTDDALLLWLRPAPLARLAADRAPPTALLLVSGSLGGLERAPLPPAWRRVAVLTYPVEAPGRWELRAARNLRPWLAQNGIAAGDERLLGNTLAACRTLAEGIYRLRGSFVRDYLLETVEAAASGMGNAGASAAFPRFMLGTGQRFASKGTYFVRLRGDAGTELDRDGEWTVP
jgi:hypothetical protein